MPKKNHLVSNVSPKYFRAQKDTNEPAQAELEPDRMNGFLSASIPIENIANTNG